MITIFFNDKPIYLNETALQGITENNFSIVDADVHHVLNNLELGVYDAFCLYGLEDAQLFKKFASNFKEIDAAGGIVRNQYKQVLFIYRNGRWDLPKGKAEKGETIEEAALREVKEECGIEKIDLKGFAEKTYHVYEMNSKKYLKSTHWYFMETWQQEFLPQEEEGISKVEWIEYQKLTETLNYTYANIKLLFLNLYP